MQTFAVMGNPIEHSLSPEIHQAFAKQFDITLSYQKILIEEDFEAAVKKFFDDGGKGLNITLPYKQRAARLSDCPSETVAQASAANTLWQQDGKLFAENTDGQGLVNDLQHKQIELTDKNILILGAGGAVRGIMPAFLKQNPKQIIIANRTESRAMTLAQQFGSGIVGTGLAAIPKLNYDLIINGTSMSLSGNVPDIALDLITDKTFCYDLAYVKAGLTEFEKCCQALGAQTANGLGMLVEQAAISFQIWHGVLPSTDDVLLGL